MRDLTNRGCLVTSNWAGKTETAVAARKTSRLHLAAARRNLNAGRLPELLALQVPHHHPNRIDRVPLETWTTELSPPAACLISVPSLRLRHGLLNCFRNRSPQRRLLLGLNVSLCQIG
jgi:hypothetical protein